ncbi:DNA polymerase III subunit beta [Candidatus Peregrinibacteria bacterium]|nr:DNA polymerase III subunit beta [Candidatus Peregrinibacteria bacterium]
MKLIVPQKELSFALNTVYKAVSPNNTLPVLNNILIKAEGKKLFFTATNLEIAINYWIGADVYNEGSITIPAKLVTSYVHLLEDGNIELKLEEGLTLSIKSQSSRTKIKGIGADEFPLIPKIEQPDIFTISSESLQEAIGQVVFAAATSNSRPVLSGVLFNLDKDVFSLVATDSYRLAEKKITLSEKVKKNIQCIVPAKTIFELGKILSSLPNNISIEVFVSKNQILFKVQNIEFVSRLIEGNFPDYDKIIPKTSKTRIQVKVSDFILAVRKVSLFVVEESNNIRLSVTNNGKLILSTGETQVGEETSEIEAQISGENNQIGLNFQFLLDILNNIHSESIVMELDNKLSPIVIRPTHKDDYVHIIMPLKI